MKLSDLSYQLLGSFHIRGKKMRVSDPCYSIGLPDDPEMMPLLDARDGEWIAQIREDNIPGWGRRVVDLTVHHSDSILDAGPWVHRTDGVGVDSGQCGFWNEADYVSGVRTRYDEICNLSSPAGILKDYGVVSSSGFGDGGYTLEVKLIDGLVVAARLTFITEDEEDEEPEDEETDDQ